MCPTSQKKGAALQNLYLDLVPAPQETLHSDQAAQEAHTEPGPPPDNTAINSGRTIYIGARPDKLPSWAVSGES